MAEGIAAGAAVVTGIIQAKTALWDPLKQTIALSNDMDEIHEGLIEVMRTLVAKKDDHEEMVNRHKATRKTSNIYNNWIDRVNVVDKEVQSLESRYKNEKKRSSWFCIHPRSSISEKMKKAASHVFALLEENLTNILVDKKPACVVDMIAPRISNIPTLQQSLEQTLKWLSDSPVRGVRIHGLVGCGKTTIMLNLNNHVKVAEIFDIVIWVTVSREGSTENKAIEVLQHIITQRLKLDIGKYDVVASRIKEELKDIKYLLLLDDVKEDLDLDQIGVPVGENGSKIVFTTRFQHICHSIATRQTHVTKLNEKEALNFFKSVLDRPNLEKNPNINRLMPLIVDLCGYHPLMIRVAAGMFKVKDTEQNWHDGLKYLRKWPKQGDGAMQETYKLLKFCFDSLQITQKKCFFYSALYPEDYDIEKDSLLDNWAAEKLLGTNDDDTEDMRVYGRGILDYLKMVSLLEENTSKDYIRIHKMIRLAALFSMSDEKHPVTSGETLLGQPLVLECWEEKIWISLVDNKLDCLPHKPDCSMLSTLFLQKNPNLKIIPLAIFEHMQSLCVLDLYGAYITSLPSSLLKLVTLKNLYLQNCVALVELPSEIEHLHKLEVLDIRGSGLSIIPPHVQKLICLRRLLVTFTTSSSSTPIQKALNESEVISKIPELKELVIDVEEEFERILYGAIVNVVKLARLSLLQFRSSTKVMDLIKVIGDSRKTHFPTEELLQSYIDKVGNFKENCQIFIGCDISSHPPITEFMPYYRFNGEVGNNTIMVALQNDVAIELVNQNELEHLSTFSAESMNRIRTCVIENCNKMRTIVVGNAKSSLVLNKLEQLHITNLPLLKNIYEGEVKGLSSLKTLILCNCPMLTSVCTYGVILQLPEIRHLQVENCSEIKEIFKDSPNIVSPILPYLEKLILVRMPQLSCILLNDSCEWDSLERLQILGCPKLKRLPFKKNSAANLASIEAEKSWWEALENDQDVKDQFRPYCTFN